MAERKAGNRSACARLTVPRRGHRPCPSAPLHLVPPGGAKPPRPVPAPPARMKAPSSLPWQRPSPLPQRVIAPCPAGGAQSPRPAPAPPPAGASRPPGRALACGWCGLRRFRRKRRARAGERLCVLGACPQGHALSRGREDLKGRQAVGLLFRHPVWPPCPPAPLHRARPVASRRQISSVLSRSQAEKCAV